VDLHDYVGVMRRRWWMLCCGVLLAVGIAVVITINTPPRYATSVTFFVTTPGDRVTDAYQGGLFSQQRVKSYADLLNSDRLAQAVVSGNGIDMSADQVRSRVSARAVPNTVLLTATVIDEAPDRSQRVAEVLATEFIKLVQALETPPGSATPLVKVEVVGGPRLNPSPVSPQPVRNVGMAALLGLIVGSAAAILREVLDTTMKTAEALQQETGVPILGTVRYDAAARKSPLIVSSEAHSARAEGYRRLRTNLQFVNVDEPVRAIVVTSAVPEEGKSTTAANLAIAFAEAGRRVLLVDADLRMPRIADYMGIEGATGVTNVLAGQVAVADVVQRWGRGGLWVLPSGSIPPNPSELLGSQNMADLLDGFRASFDMVILDTPPLLPVTDAAVVAARADGAVLVARCGKTTRAQIGGAMQALRAVDARVLGCVLSMVQPEAPGAYDYYYGYGYGAQSMKDARRPPRHPGDGPFAGRDVGRRPPTHARPEQESAALSAARGDQP
jgi:capsular exopolysaccharide synthesis family protein